MPLIGYARVSTRDQNLQAQLEQLQAAGCKRIFQEKVSGAKRDRAELEAMLNWVQGDDGAGDVVVVTKLDRIARSMKDLWEIIERLEAKKVGFKVLNNPDLNTTSATGKLMLSILGAVAQFEREMLLERQAEGIEIAKRAGKYIGRQPTAQRQSGKVLELLAAGKSKLQVAKELKIGKSSVYRIAAEQVKLL